MLEELEAANLFLIPLDDTRTWYRYHHLFGTLLRHQLERQEGKAGTSGINVLHERASDWFARYETAHERFTAAEAVYGRIAPGQEGAEDLPRAFALSRRHRGRALRGMGRLDESRGLLTAVAEFFGDQGEAYNQARALTDLAETLHDMGENTEALAKIAQAEPLLPPSATPHLGYLAALRLRCEVTG